MAPSPFPGGFAEARPRRALWVGTWVILGDQAGTHIDTIYPIAVGVAVLALIARAVLRRRRTPAEPAE